MAQHALMSTSNVLTMEHGSACIDVNLRCLDYGAWLSMHRCQPQMCRLWSMTQHASMSTSDVLTMEHGSASIDVNLRCLDYGAWLCTHRCQPQMS